jgi:thioredoxin 1
MTSLHRNIILIALLLAVAGVFLLKNERAGMAAGSESAPAVLDAPREAPSASVIDNQGEMEEPAGTATPIDDEPGPTGYEAVLTAAPVPPAAPDDDCELDAPEPCDEPAPTVAALPRLVSLGAGQCIPCKRMEPVREELRAEYAGRLVVEFYDVWLNPQVGNEYGIRAIPTLIFYDASGGELGRREGYMSKRDILSEWRRMGVDLDASAGV